MMFRVSNTIPLKLALTVAVLSTSGAFADEATNSTPAVATNAVVAKPAEPTKPTNAVPAAATSPRASVPTTALNYEAFSIVADRNIFNQSRYPRSSRGSATNIVRRTPKIDSLTLVGTMDYEKGKMAFFDGSSSQFKKVVKIGDSVGAFKLLEITPNQVKLATDKAEMQLLIGQALRREDEGEWQVSSVSVIGSGSASVASSGSSAGDTKPAESGSSSGSSSSGGSADDALKRLLERRAKETNE